jgi:hypothetical protein
MFDEDHIAPPAVMLADALASADFAEPGCAVECGTGDILGKDAGLNGPDAGIRGRGDKRVE